MDTAQWPQEIVVKPIEEKKTRPQALNCPRCNSTNTKFCYYNNYSLTQPRYFCKTCKRYWTEGGSLRNIPVGGGSRKNKTSPSSNSYSSSKSKLPDLVTHRQNPNKIHDQGQDLNLAFPNSIKHDTDDKISSSTSNTTTTTSSTLNHNNHQLSAMELTTGISSRGLNSFMPMNVVQDPNAVYRTSVFPVLHDFKQPTIIPTTLNFSLDHGLGSSGGYGSSSVLQGFHQDHHTSSSTSGRLLFPFEDLKQVSSTSTDIEQNREVHGDSTGYWTGMLGGGSW